MDKPLISFCIPTYNRCELLVQNVLEIISQATENKFQVEICISDNCSIDDTMIEINSIPNTKYAKIVFHSNEVNIGPDLNYLKSVDLATSEFCWFMGSDDKIAPGSLKSFVEKDLQSGSDIFVFERIDCTLDMLPFGLTKWNKTEKKRSYHLGNDLDLIDYFDSSISLGAIFSFLSSIVFRKSIWNQIEYDTKFTGTAYSHVFMLLKYIEFNAELTYIPKPYVLCRHGNDHFMSNGYTKRFMIDIDGYLLLSQTFFFKKETVKRSFMNVMKREHNNFFILFIHSLSDSNDWKSIKDKLGKYGYNNLLLLLTIILPRKLSFIIFKFNNLFQKLKIHFQKRTDVLYETENKITSPLH